MILYHGTCWQNWEQIKEFGYLYSKLNKFHTPDNLTYTTTDEKVAEEFAKYNGDGVVLKLDLPFWFPQFKTTISTLFKKPVVTFEMPIPLEYITVFKKNKWDGPVGTRITYVDPINTKDFVKLSMECQQPDL